MSLTQPQRKLNLNFCEFYIKFYLHTYLTHLKTQQGSPEVLNQHLLTTN